MGKDMLDAEPITVESRFKEEMILTCPLFQRPYVWGQKKNHKNIEKFWDDLDTVLDEEYPSRFLGALVFSADEAGSANQAGQFWVIDGQQRLTTLYLILLAIAERATEFGEAGHKLAEETFERYLVCTKRKSRGCPKLRPTLGDSRQFQTLIAQAASKAGVGDWVQASPATAPGDPDGALIEGYEVINKRIDRELNERGENAFETLDDLRSSVLDSLEFVEIRLGSENDPNEVFDRLNNVGEKLGIVDLVRNDVLKNLDSDPQKAQSVYSNDWLPFENSFADDQAKAKYFFPFALTLDSAATQSSTFATLSKHLTSSRDSDEVAVRDMVRVLRRHQIAYNAIASGELDSLNEPVRERVRRLVDMNCPSSIYPYVMQLLTGVSEGAVTSQAAAACLDVIESFLVRRAIRGIEPTGLHAIFKRLWEVAGDDPVAVRSSITSKTVYFPTDDEVKGAVLTGDLYHRKVCRYAIIEYERATTSGDILETFPPVTIDHVMPQARKEQWEATVSEADHAELLHTWGNLVPLSREANSTKNAGSWEEARGKLKNETVFSTTKTLYDSNETWTATEIRARGTLVADWAVERWPYFGDLLS